MPNDAKLGLVVGLGLVVAVAVMFFRKDVGPAQGPAEAPGPEDRPGVLSAPRGLFRQVKAKTANQAGEAPAGRRHVVKEGDTLFSLAQRYYGDGELFIFLYQVNRNVLENPDRLTPGTVLALPEPEETAPAGPE